MNSDIKKPKRLDLEWGTEQNFVLSLDLSGLQICAVSRNIQISSTFGMRMCNVPVVLFCYLSGQQLHSQTLYSIPFFKFDL